MKKFTTKKIPSLVNPLMLSAGFIFWSASVSTLFGQNLSPQEVTYQKKSLQVTKQKTNEMDEATLRQKMKADGLLDPVIDKLIAQRKVWMQQGKNLNWTSVKNSGGNLTPNAACGDMGAENGWGSWLGDIGTANSGSQTWTPPPVFPTAPNFSITTGPGIDPNTPSTGNPIIPIVCPGFGNASIEVGEICQAGCVAEQLTYPINVTINDTVFTYAYAIVLEDAGSGHSVSEQPFVNISVLDINGDTLPACAYWQYTGGPNVPGFFPVNGLDCGWVGSAQYKPWTIVGINLAPYVGTVVTVVITNVDCALCGHWAYSYWDFLCGSAALSAGCIGNQSTICGPSDPNIAYTYQWYNNGIPIAPPQGTQQCITVTALPTDTFSVQVLQPSGCKFQLGYVPAVLQQGFTYTGNCGNFTFTDTSAATPSSVSMTNWNWSFPGGTPSSATTPTVSVTYNTPGTYVVTCTVTCSAGCSGVVTHTVNVTALPTAAIISSPPCLGGAVILTDGSISPAGDPITQWNWSMPGGNPATSASQNTSTNYLASGPHTVTLTVTTQSGCTSSISQQVIVYNPPVANFSGSGTGCAPVCVTNYTDLSTSTDGNIANWAWSFPGGTPVSSTSQNPGTICYTTAGTYGASLIVTTIYGCKDTINITPIVTPRPWPNADFCLDPNNQASAADPVFYFCDLWSNDVTSGGNWVWDFGDGTTLSGSGNVNTDPVHSYSASITTNDFYPFTVCLRVENQYTCWDTICKTVEILPEYTFYIPNTFTPNSDIKNELFFGKGRGIKEYNIWLFDRWGNVIWDCHYTGLNVSWDDPAQDGMPSACKWDGKVTRGGWDMSGGSNQLAQEDVYVWKVKLTDVFDKKHTYVGHVNVVR